MMKEANIKEYVTPNGAVLGIKRYCKKYVKEPNSQKVINAYLEETNPEERRKNYVAKCIYIQQNFGPFVEWCKEKYKYNENLKQTEAWID